MARPRLGSNLQPKTRSRPAQPRFRYLRFNFAYRKNAHFKILVQGDTLLSSHGCVLLVLDACFT
jgi:hypothetical protein